MKLLLLVILSAAFVLTHIGLSARSVRDKLVGKLGEWGFRGFYSVIAILTLVGAILVFGGNTDMGPRLWEVPMYLKVIPALLMLLAFPLVIFGVLQPGPTGIMPGSSDVRGIKRISRHPMNMGLAAFGLAHLIGNGHLGDVFFFGAIFVVGFFGAYHQDARKSRELGESYREFKSETSVLPFAAVATGKTKLQLDELNKPLLIGSLILYLVFFGFHGPIFGNGVF